jgi:hypothetical protein
MAGAQQMPLTMGQSRGLVAAHTPAVEPLKAFEWESIEKGVACRQDAYCPICMEGFNRGYEVLLSCSHMYHRSCLQSFEKFMKTAERSCPICRTTNYQKKITVRALLGACMLQTRLHILNTFKNLSLTSILFFILINYSTLELKPTSWCVPSLSRKIGGDTGVGACTMMS